MRHPARPSPRRVPATCTFAGLVLLLAGAPARAAAPKLPPAAPAFDFEREVRPILETACVSCHGPAKQKGGLRLDTREALLKGGGAGAAIVPGKSADSELVKMVARLDEDAAMPPEKKDALTAAQVGILRAWIDAGAPYPKDARLSAPAVTASAAKPLSTGKIPAAVARKVDFLRDVRPIFETRCAECHGPAKQEGGLRLDHKETLFSAGELGPRLVPGKGAESLLVHFVAGLRDEGRMPKKGPPLTDEQIGILRAWIDQGADFPESASVKLADRKAHWAFKAPARPPAPAVKNANWVRTPIDAYVLSKLEREGLAPSPEADKVTLLRRLHFDLVGLPPTVEDVDAFLADKSPGAYDKVVERLLASPHYGERWGRHWLDAARYADSDGFEKDKRRTVHFYRDWVIGAYNRDLPYDRFIVEQLAGDLLPNATQEQLVATGFLRNSMLNEEGGADPEQFRIDALFDRMDALGRSVLGLTVQCAQCHNHKFDPISQEEYFRLFAFLNNDDEPIRAVYTPAEEKRRGEVLRKIGEVERALQAANPDWRARLARWEADEARRAAGGPKWVTLQAPFIDDTIAGSKYLLQKDGSYLQQSYAPTKHTAQVVVKTDLPEIGAFQIEQLTDPNLPLGGPGRSFMGTSALTEFMVDAAPADAPDKKVRIKLVKATSDFEQAEKPLEPTFADKTDRKRVTGPAAYAIDGNDETAWGIDAGPGRRNVDRKAVFLPEKPIKNAKGTIFTFHLRQAHGGWNSDDHQNNNLGRFRLSVTGARDVVADPVPKRVREILAIPAAKRTAAQTAAVFSYFRTTVPAWKKENARVDELWKGYPVGQTALVLATRAEMRPTHLFKRGDFLKPGKAVTPGVLSALHPLPKDAPPNRLGLARWLVDRKSPTTARVYVNRIWQAYFGTGIVATSDDLGVQSEAPSHPELLDWLATELMDRGWSTKALHRLIVRSATYRQASRTTPAHLEKDPQNRLLARGPRIRVEAEIVRDVFLASSGLLNRQVGGPSVMPPAPGFLFLPPSSYAPFTWTDETGPDRYRRAVYTFRRRSTPYPMLQTFDAPNGDTACVRRPRSNTPLQALVGLNETVSMEAAQALARRMLEAKGRSTPLDDRARILHGFRRVLSRPPTATEERELLGLLARQRKRVAEGWSDAWLLATGKGEAPGALPAGVTPADLAAYTVVGRVLLNLDEAITKE
jgi:mono/diheme cytochrome c family protein